MSWYLIAETSAGTIVAEGWYEGDTEKIARHRMWLSLEHNQRDTISSIECVETKP